MINQIKININHFFIKEEKVLHLQIMMKKILNSYKINKKQKRKEMFKPKKTRIFNKIFKIKLIIKTISSTSCNSSSSINSNKQKMNKLIFRNNNNNSNNFNKFKSINPLKKTFQNKKKTVNRTNKPKLQIS